MDGEARKEQRGNNGEKYFLICIQFDQQKINNVEFF